MISNNANIWLNILNYPTKGNGSRNKPINKLAGTELLPVWRLMKSEDIQEGP